MNFKINSIVIPSILAFALIAGIIPAGFAQNNTGMTTSEDDSMTGMTQDGNMTQGESGNMTGMTQSQSADEDGNDGDEDGNNDGDNSEDDKDKGE
jgi:hypothetical protein